MPRDSERGAWQGKQQTATAAAAAAVRGHACSGRSRAPPTTPASEYGTGPVHRSRDTTLIRCGSGVGGTQPCFPHVKTPPLGEGASPKFFIGSALHGCWGGATSTNLGLGRVDRRPAQSPLPFVSVTSRSAAVGAAWHIGLGLDCPVFLGTAAATCVAASALPGAHVPPYQTKAARFKHVAARCRVLCGTVRPALVACTQTKLSLQACIVAASSKLQHLGIRRSSTLALTSTQSCHPDTQRTDTPMLLPAAWEWSWTRAG